MIKNLIVVGMFSFLISLALVSASTSEYHFDIDAKALERANSDLIFLKGNGEFDVKTKEIEGNGTFVRRDTWGNLIMQGRWEAKKLDSFKRFGTISSSYGFPIRSEGGRALIKIVLYADSGENYNSVLRVDANYGTTNRNVDSGIRVSIRELKLNFDTPWGGSTLFVRE